ncbi:hypothetical protein XENOCAPTIV_009645, partial [Xenoophorus captivus]
AAQLLPNEVVSEQQSLLVVKKLLAIAVSGITYLRGIFPGRAYGSKYVEVTPQDYQPPGFREAEGNTIEFEQEPIKLTMGKVTTPYHHMKFDMATEKRRLEQVNCVEESVSVKERWILSIEEEVDLTQTGIHEKNESTEEIPAVRLVLLFYTLCIVSQYDILSSQESSSGSDAMKKRKFSEPKDHY